MIAVSSRHVPLLLGLALLLGLPVLWNRFEVRRVEDCARPSELLRLSRIPGSGGLTERYEKYDLDVRQWTETDLRPEQRGIKLRGALVRSFRPIDLYTRPPTLLLGPIDAGPRRVDWVEEGDEGLPIQTIHDSLNGRQSLASWLFVYGGEPVERPAWHQLLAAPWQLWDGSRPLTLLLVAGPVQPDRREQAREIAQRWLVDAYRFYRRACVTPRPGETASTRLEERVDERGRGGPPEQDERAQQQHRHDDRREPPLLVVAQEVDELADQTAALLAGVGGEIDGLVGLEIGHGGLRCAHGAAQNCLKYRSRGGIGSAGVQ